MKTCSIVSDQRIDSEYFQQSEESDQFKQEYEMRRIKQASVCVCVLLFVIWSNWSEQECLNTVEAGSRIGFHIRRIGYAQEYGSGHQWGLCGLSYGLFYWSYRSDSLTATYITGTG